MTGHRPTGPREPGLKLFDQSYQRDLAYPVGSFLPRGTCDLKVGGPGEGLVTVVQLIGTGVGRYLLT